MSNLKEVKNRITSIQSTQQITSAMKMVAAAKLRKAQDKITKMRPYSEKLTGILKNVSSGLDDAGNIYSQEREVEKVLLVVVTSDRGLCGSFNSNVFKSTVALINEKYSSVESNGGLYIMPIGKRSNDYFVKRKYQVLSDHALIINELSFDVAKKAAEQAMNGFAQGEFDRVELVYNEFKNVATQILRTEQFLPIPAAEAEDDSAVASNIDYLFEPSQSVVVDEIIPKSLKIQFYKALLESNASEHGARMTAMDQATDNAGELLKELRLTYNRTRQAAITKEILEIVGGAEALAANG